VNELKTKYPIAKICKKLNISRTGYYKYLKTKEKKKKEFKRDQQLKEYIISYLFSMNTKEDAAIEKYTPN
jgi:ACT domain-containing protein